MLKDVQFEEQFIQLSFDIISLFPSILVKPTLSIIHKKLQNDKTLKDRTTWKPKNIVNLIQICTEETHFKDFEGHIWTQIDGTAMGKSISGDVAGIFMESYENEFVLDPEKNKFVPIFWKREVDDVYCLWQYGEEHIQDFLEYLNGCHQRIKWTIEVEKEGKLSFVDLNTGIYDDITIPGNSLPKNDSNGWCFFRKWNLFGHGGATTALLKVEVSSEIQGFRINVHRWL